MMTSAAAPIATAAGGTLATSGNSGRTGPQRQGWLLANKVCTANRRAAVLHPVPFDRRSCLIQRARLVHPSITRQWAASPPPR
jgi:hypothetical protein